MKIMLGLFGALGLLITGGCTIEDHGHHHGGRGGYYGGYYGEYPARHYGSYAYSPYSYYSPVDRDHYYYRADNFRYFGCDYR